MRTKALSKRAVRVIAEAGVVDFTAEDAAQRILDVPGCGRRTLRHIAETVEKLHGQKLGGFEKAMNGYSVAPTMTTEDAARGLGVEPAVFVDLARKTGVAPKRRRDGRFWSERDVAAVRRFTGAP